MLISKVLMDHILKLCFDKSTSFCYEYAGKAIFGWYMCRFHVWRKRGDILEFLCFNTVSTVLILFWPFRRREKKKCPQCNVEVYNVPTHVKRQHNWSNKSSKSFIGQLSIRKACPKKSTKKDYRHKKVSQWKDASKWSKM